MTHQWAIEVMHLQPRPMNLYSAGRGNFDPTTKVSFRVEGRIGVIM